MRIYCVSIYRDTCIEMNYCIAVQAFARLDLSDSGVICRDDIRQLLNEDISEEEMDELFNYSDEISKTDFLKRMREKKIYRTRTHMTGRSDEFEEIVQT